MYSPAVPVSLAQRLASVSANTATTDPSVSTSPRFAKILDEARIDEALHVPFDPARDETHPLLCPLPKHEKDESDERVVSRGDSDPEPAAFEMFGGVHHAAQSPMPEAHVPAEAVNVRAHVAMAIEAAAQYVDVRWGSVRGARAVRFDVRDGDYAGSQVMVSDAGNRSVTIHVNGDSALGDLLAMKMRDAGLDVTE